MNRNVSVVIDQSRFNYRVAGIVIEDNHVLLHKFEHDGFWALPGGRCEVGEHSNRAVVREFAEELGVEARAERLVWMVENFFEFDGVANHEIGMYYKVAFEDPTLFADKTKIYEGVEGELTLLYKWFPLSELTDVELYPIFLRDRLQALPETLEHIIHQD